MTAEGALLVVAGDALWRRGPGGPWETIPLPAPPGDSAAGARLRPYGVWSDGAGVWVTADYAIPVIADAAADAPVQYRHVLLRTGWQRPVFDMKPFDRCAALNR